MSDRDKLLEVTGLDVFYGDLQAIKDINIEVHKGDMVALIGANGVGKSTLLQAIMGLNKPKNGSVKWKGKEIVGMTTNKIAQLGIAMTPEGSHIFEDMTVYENLLLGAYPKHAKARREESKALVYKTFPALKEKEKQLATFLSGGQRQMLAIARAMMASPELIICDEISLGLAPIMIKDIYASLHTINEAGVSFLLVEQETKRALRNSNYAYVIVHGQVVMEGPSNTLSEEKIAEVYFGVDQNEEKGGDE
ncbi:MAG: ABC transporter ATP-binding protein [Parasporobacterium sp.]|nr:ABC transporter ATP-binding protein [Parasporobacterium sp.]